MPAFIVPNRSQQILLTEVSLDTVTPPGSAVNIINDLVDSLDTSAVEAQYDVESDTGHLQ